MNTRKNTLYNVAYRVFSMLLPLVTAPYLSRVVGTEGVGLYGYSWAVSYVFVLIGLLGLENYGPREIARVRDDRDALNRTFSAIWKMQRLVAGVTLLVWLVYVFFIAGEEKIISLNLTMMSVSCLVNLDWCLMGLDEFKPIALRNTAVKLLAAAAVFLFVRKPEDLWVYAFVWSLSTLLGCVSCMFSLRGKVTPVKVTWKEALKHLAPCALLSISVIAVSVYRQMDKVMIGALADMAQTGLYENAEKIILCLSGFISAIGTVMLPKVSRMTRMKQMDAVKRHIRLSMELVMCMVCAMAFGLAAVAVNFAPLFYGDDFAYSGHADDASRIYAPVNWLRERHPHTVGAAAGPRHDFRPQCADGRGHQPDCKFCADSAVRGNGRGGGDGAGGVFRSCGAVCVSAQGTAVCAVPENDGRLLPVRAGDGGRGRSAWARSPAARLGETRGSGNRWRGGVWRAVPDILDIGKAQRHFPPDAEKINPPFPS